MIALVCYLDYTYTIKIKICLRKNIVWTISDLQIGSYLDLEAGSCNRLCTAGSDCCDEKALCTCGTTSGHYACLCRQGFYGTGLKGDCQGMHNSKSFLG